MEHNPGFSSTKWNYFLISYVFFFFYMMNWNPLRNIFLLLPYPSTGLYCMLSNNQHLLVYLTEGLWALHSFFTSICVQPYKLSSLDATTWIEFLYKCNAACNIKLPDTRVGIKRKIVFLLLSSSCFSSSC